MTAWTARLRELVTEGPVPFSKAQSEMARLVPPGRGLREAQRYVDWGRNKNNVKTPLAEETEARKDQLIARGRLKLAYVAIWTQARAGHVEVYEEADQKMVRLTAKGWA